MQYRPVHPLLRVFALKGSIEGGRAVAPGIVSHTATNGIGTDISFYKQNISPTTSHSLSFHATFSTELDLLPSTCRPTPVGCLPNRQKAATEWSGPKGRPKGGPLPMRGGRCECLQYRKRRVEDALEQRPKTPVGKSVEARSITGNLKSVMGVSMRRSLGSRRCDAPVE